MGDCSLTKERHLQNLNVAAQVGFSSFMFTNHLRNLVCCLRELKLNSTRMLRGSGIKAFLPILQKLIQQGRLKRIEMHGTNWEQHLDKPHGATKKQFEALRNEWRKSGVEIHGI